MVTFKSMGVLKAIVPLKILPSVGNNSQKLHPKNSLYTHTHAYILMHTHTHINK